MADVILQITVPDAKVTMATEAFLALYPNTELNNRVDVHSGLKYTTKQWVEEKLMRNFITDIHKGRQIIANRELQVDLDYDVATRT